MLKTPYSLRQAWTPSQAVLPDPTQQLLHELKDTSPWLYESLRAQGVMLDEDLPTITY
jgi:hypothetical protein